MEILKILIIVILIIFVSQCLSRIDFFEGYNNTIIEHANIPTYTSIYPILTFKNNVIFNSTFVIGYNSYDKSILNLSIGGECEYSNIINTTPVFNIIIKSNKGNTVVNINPIKLSKHMSNTKLSYTATFNNVLETISANIVLNNSFTVSGNLKINNIEYPFNDVTFSTDSTNLSSYLNPSGTPIENNINNNSNIRIEFKLDTLYPEENDINNTINNIIDELSSVLSVSKNQFNKAELFPGSIIVNINILSGNNINPMNLFDRLKYQVDNGLLTDNEKYPTLKKVNKEYSVTIINSLEIYTLFSNIIPKKQNILDVIVNNNLLFALTTKATNISIPKSSSDGDGDLMYLTVPLTHEYVPCTTLNGMLELNPKLTKGGIFSLSQVSKYFKYLDKPYKYIDFSKIIPNNETQITSIESIFYNMKLHHNNYSVSYCQRGCDATNPTGFCAQEKNITEIPSSMYDDEFNRDDYGIKNLLKFKIENDNSVTPYFISLNKSGNERIHFITNKYNTINNPEAHRSLVQVPIYSESDAYYNMPNYEPGVMGSKPIYTPDGINVHINNISPEYKQHELDNYSSLASFDILNTLISKSDAYQIYAFSFNIEIININTYNSTDLN